ncbi:TonB-dependent receptor [Niastella koreensis]|uniref:TonB-dependent siderophore receptor n=2 Tax=Niastella koreensis TaxID=354356 RepID=G8T8B7_NIAKG|nr:TonB-dependent receptor [Niastella koreensis]AEV99087.1 TonB-dependent siderophore receptor [Niastella koreensis GR20-10]OQP44001.1 TonB-dependent receptor [Niastella koreensis]
MKIMLRFALFLFLVTGLQTASLAQSGALQGKVTTADGKPAEGITVGITNKKWATATNQQGEYKLTGIKPGSYTIRVTAVGLKAVDKTVTLNEGEILVTDFVLTENHATLQEVVIAAGKRSWSDGSETVAKMPLSRLENPQAYTSLSNNLIKEQITTDFGNILKNTPGLYKIQGNRGINSDGASYYSLRGFRTEVSLVDGVPAQTNGEMDPINVERIEVLKGPSATLYGGALTSFGGLINIVTKKPIDSFGGEISYSAGSYNLNRVTADIYGPANKEGNVLFRLNAAYQNQGSWQDAGFRKSLLLAPAIELRASNIFKINLTGEFYSAEMTSPSVIFLNRTRQFVAHTPDELGFTWNRSYTTNDLTIKTPTSNLRAIGTYKLSNNWTSQTIISCNTRKSDGYYQYEFIRKSADDTLERNITSQNTINTTIGVQQNFTGNFNTGTVRHRLLVGLDYVRLRVNNDNSPYIVFDYVNGTYNDDRNLTKISRYAADQKIAASTDAPTRNHTTSGIYSAYASDVVNVTGNLMALLSVRVDRFESKGTRNHSVDTVLANTRYTQTAVSPKFGLVYQVVKDKVSLFANYMNGFSNLAPVTQPVPEVSGVLKPQQANQVEGGVKVDLFNDKLRATASYYDIKVDNMPLTDVYVKDGRNYNITVQEGTQRSKGFELEVQANPIDGLNILAGYSYNNSKLTKAAAALNGRRPAAAGPANLANAWISYTLPTGKLKGLGAGVGGNYVDKHLTANSAATGVFTLPSYTLINGTVFYDATHYRLGVKIDNATDVRYFVGQGVLSPQMPCTLTANVTIKF